MRYAFQSVPTVDAIVADLRLQTGLDIRVDNQSTMSEGSPEEKIWFTLAAEGFTPVEEVNIYTHTGEITAIANMGLSLIKPTDLTYLQMMLSFTLHDLGGRRGNNTPETPPTHYETYAHRTWESLSWLEKKLKVHK
jgi:hypothetical protein